MIHADGGAPLAGGLTHLDEQGRVRMVDVGAKPVTLRSAVARGRVAMRPETLRELAAGTVPKGDALAAARIAGVMAAKETSRLIPLCHPLPLTSVRVDIRADAGVGAVEIEARVETAAATGVEMEALTAVSVAALTIYDMCKAMDKEMVIGDIRLVEKKGGRSGHYRRPGEPEPNP